MNTTILHNAEMTKVRFWQETALRALQALVTANPPPTDDPDSKAFKEWASKVSGMSWELAEKMFRGHGPVIEPGLVGYKYFASSQSEQKATS